VADATASAAQIAEILSILCIVSFSQLLQFPSPSFALPTRQSFFWIVAARAGTKVVSLTTSVSGPARPNKER